MFNPRSVPSGKVRQTSVENNTNTSQLEAEYSSSKHSVSVNRVTEVDSRQRVMMEKEKRRKDEEEKHIRQLDLIRQENATKRQEAI